MNWKNFEGKDSLVLSQNFRNIIKNDCVNVKIQNTFTWQTGTIEPVFLFANLTATISICSVIVVTILKLGYNNSISANR